MFLERNVMDFIENLTKVMKTKGITAYRLCIDLKIGMGTIASWKNGRYPTIDKLVKICQYLEISADALLGLEYNNLLTQDELIILDMYRKLPKDEKKELKSIMEIKLNKIKTRTTSSNLTTTKTEEPKIS